MDSYEHEITFSGSQFEKDRISALEKTLQNYKDMIDRMGNEPTSASSGADFPDQKTLQEIQTLKQQLNEANEKYETLKLELERRAIKGDFDPTTTKVLHFT